MISRGRLLVIALYAIPVLLKIVFSAGVTTYGHDGSYYAGIAQHVAEGEGLVTRVSLFHHGYERFPHPSPVYPLWPLVLGAATRIVGLEVAAVWLPTLLYFAAIFFAWKWGTTLPRVPLFARLPDGPDTAHAVAWLLAWNVLFFEKTSVPYTEALAMTLVFACLWRSHRLFAERGWRRGAELGVWLGLIFLTRSQLVLVAMAAACALVWGLAAMPGRRKTLAMAAACAAVATLLVLPQYLRLAETTTRPATALLRFEVAQANERLSPVHVLADTEGGLATVLDRLRGVPIAFSPVHPMAYIRSFMGLQYAVLLALPFLVLRVRREGLRAWLAWAADPARLPLVFAVFFAAGGLTSLHLVHKDFGSEWHFARRHALTALFAFHLAWCLLMCAGRPLLRRAALVLFVAALGGGLTQMVRLAGRTLRDVETVPSRAGLVAFLRAQPRGAGGLPVAITAGDPQRLALVTREAVNYHWLHLGSSLDDVATLFRHFGVRFLLLRRDSEHADEYAFLHPRARFDASLRHVAEIDGYGVYVWREPLRAETP